MNVKRMARACGLLCCLAVCASPAEAADRTLRDDQGRSVVLRQSPKPDFFHYTNERFAFTVEVPALFGKAFVIPDNGDGIILGDAADQARFRASGGNRINKKTLKQLFEDARKDLEIKPAYAHLGKDFFVLSWERDGEIHYRKFILGATVYCDVELTYPAARKQEFDPLVARSAGTLKLL